jgi:glycosyltransferase involved in cell wall biosynthesis
METPLRILFVGNDFRLAGGATLLIRKAQWFKTHKNAEIYMCTAGYDDFMRQHWIDLGGILIEMSFLNEYYYTMDKHTLINGIQMLNDVVRKYDINLIEANESSIAPFAECIANLNHLPCILMNAHAVYVRKKYKPLLTAASREKRLVSFYGLESLMQKTADLSGTEIKPIYFHLDIKSLEENEAVDKASLRQNWGVKENQLIILTISRASTDKKYVEYLIEQMPKIAKRHALKLFIVGDGELQQRWEQNASRINQQLQKWDSEIVFFGIRLDLQKFYCSADIFVGMGTTVQEAGLYGCPTVSTCHPPYHEWAAGINGKDGYVRFGVAKESNYRLEDAILLLINNPALKEKAAKTWQNYVMENCLTDKVMQTWSDYYQQLLHDDVFKAKREFWIEEISFGKVIRTLLNFFHWVETKQKTSLVWRIIFDSLLWGIKTQQLWAVKMRKGKMHKM